MDAIRIADELVKEFEDRLGGDEKLVNLSPEKIEVELYDIMDTVEKTVESRLWDRIDEAVQRYRKAHRIEWWTEEDEALDEVDEDAYADVDEDR